jgi:hypothetical protein
MTMQRRISLAIPVFNEEAVLPELLTRVTRVLDGIPGGPHEVVFVNDGSRDRSQAMLEAAAAADPRFVVIQFSRNFGHQAALSAALDQVTGDAVLTMDADLQDTPEVLPSLLARLDEGFDVVVVRRIERKESAWKRAAYHVAYRLIARMSDVPIGVDAGDFALMSRRVVDALTALPERERYLRGLRSWVGFRQTAVEVPRAAPRPSTPSPGSSRWRSTVRSPSPSSRCASARPSALRPSSARCCSARTLSTRGSCWGSHPRASPPCSSPAPSLPAWCSSPSGSSASTWDASTPR